MKAKLIAYLLKNYPVWPAATDTPGAATHHGYHWERANTDAEWVLRHITDIVTKADYNQAFLDSIVMADLFSTEGPVPDYSQYDPDGEIQLSFSVKEARAAFHAIRCYDSMKAKLAKITAIHKILGETL